MADLTPENKVLGAQFGELFRPVFNELQLLSKHYNYIVSDDIYYSPSKFTIYTPTMYITIGRFGLDVCYINEDHKQVYLYENCCTFELCAPDTYDEALRILEYVRMIVMLIRYRSTIRTVDPPLPSYL